MSGQNNNSTLGNQGQQDASSTLEQARQQAQNAPSKVSSSIEQTRRQAQETLDQQKPTGGGLFSGITSGVDKIMTGGDKADRQGGLLGGLGGAISQASEGVGSALDNTGRGVGNMAGSLTEGTGQLGSSVAGGVSSAFGGLAGSKGLCESKGGCQCAKGQCQCQTGEYCQKGACEKKSCCAGSSCY